MRRIEPHGHWSVWEGNQITIQPIILSGGSGTRLWPLSRHSRPKQFLSVAGDESLLARTLHRLDASDAFSPPVLVCNEEHRFLVAEELREAGISGATILLEPCPRNTAPALVIAALIVLEDDPDALLLCLPCDHLIAPAEEFLKSVALAEPAAREGYFVCFGVPPTRPETGFGYIAAGEEIDTAPGCRMVGKFVEKPNAETAAGFLADGNYLWNAGIFLIPGRRLLEELETLEPEMVARCREAVSGAREDLDFLRLDGKAFAAAKDISIDNALMERTSRAAVAQVSFDWSDLGSYAALWAASPKDDAGNAAIGDVIARDTRDSLLYSEAQLLAAVNVEKLSVIATQDVVLVAPNDNDIDLKSLVKELREMRRDEADTHATVYRPWGSYRTTMTGQGYLVKEIVVAPGRRLSSQYHNHRAEHWVVVEGTAKIEKNGETIILEKDQSLYIPLKAVHRLENSGTTPLHLIEVQTGSYLAEDDIVRVEDDYRRSSDD